MKNQVKKCPNCGAVVLENTANCGYCNFVLADKEAIQLIDDSILKIENSIFELNKFSAITYRELALILNVFSFLLINIAYTIDQDEVNSFFIAFEIILIISVLINKYTRRFVFKFNATKRACKTNLKELSKQYPQNKKLIELSLNFKIRIDIINKKIRKNVLVTIIVFAVVFAGVFSIRYIPFANDNSDVDFTDRIINIKPTEIIISSKIDIDVLNKDFNIMFTKHKKGILLEIDTVRLIISDSSLISKTYLLKLSILNQKREILSMKNEDGNFLFFPPFEEDEAYIDSLDQYIKLDAFYYSKEKIDNYIKLLESSQDFVLIFECNEKSWQEPFF